MDLLPFSSADGRPTSEEDIDEQVQLLNDRILELIEDMFGLTPETGDLAQGIEDLVSLVAKEAHEVYLEEDDLIKE